MFDLFVNELFVIWALSHFFKVDYIIVVEATMTFTGHKKVLVKYEMFLFILILFFFRSQELVYEKNKRLFTNYHEKIRHVVMTQALFESEIIIEKQKICWLYWDMSILNHKHCLLFKFCARCTPWCQDDCDKLECKPENFHEPWGHEHSQVSAMDYQTFLHLLILFGRNLCFSSL